SLHTVSLAEAREAALECRKLRFAGKDPLRAKRAAVVPAFGEFAEAYIDKQAPGWHGKRTPDEWYATLRNHVFPRIGSLPVNQIDAQTVLRAIRPLWDKTPEQGRRVLRRIEGHRNPETPNPARWQGNMKYLLPAPPAVPGEHYESMAYRDIP